MSIRQGNKLLSAGQSLTQNLFDFKWADHILDDIQWLRADTFTWHDGRVYEAAYQHLLAEWNEVGDVPSTEIIAGTQIYYRLAPDGHKICSVSQEDEAVAIYEATGIAWYYILDTTNQRFKLPRTKFGFVGLRDNNVGKYVAPGLPNITGSFDVLLNGTVKEGNKCSSLTVLDATGAFYGNKTANTDWHFAPEEISTNQNGHDTPSFDASRSSSVYGASTTVQSSATQMYLYFFVGNFAQSAVVNTAGINATLIDEIQGECIDLQNNKQDTATAVNYNNITNCITEIPQDINLTLSSGTLTLKAGSKVYVPNGAGVFNTITIENDISVSGASTSPGTVRMLYYIGHNAIAVFAANLSGTTPPTSGTNQVFYNTSDNTIKRYTNGSVAASGYSFPLALIKDDGTYLHGSIEQVFNGFGYIGSTIFALPGVKGLIPNGRNTDGSLNNKSFTLTRPAIMTMSSWMAGRNNAPLTIFDNGNLGGMDIDYTYWGTVHNLSQVASSYHYYSCWFCLEDNKMHYFNGDAEESISSRAFIGTFNVDSNNKITYLAPKTAYRAVDYSDAGFIAHQAMPSNKYVNLTLGASGSNYTAPADGWFMLIKEATAVNQYIEMFSSGGIEAGDTASGNQYLYAFLPVSKGSSVGVYYTAAGSTIRFRFIYANGAI